MMFSKLELVEKRVELGKFSSPDLFKFLRFIFCCRLLNYVGYQLFEVGKILSKISVSYNKSVNHNYLWEKFCKISKDVVDIYRVLINQSINNLLSISNKR